MMNDSLETHLKLQLCDELADVLHIYMQNGRSPARSALQQVLDSYAMVHQDARILLTVGVIERFIEDSAGMDILEVADLLGHAEVAIADVDATSDDTNMVVSDP